MWDSNEMGHGSMSKQLEKFDPELSNLPTDICFYLTRKKISPLEFDLSYSSWTGEAADDGLGSRIHIKRLIKYDGMKKILPLITSFMKNNNIKTPEDLDDYNDPSPDLNAIANANLRSSNDFKPSSIASWERSQAIKPYRWRNSMHRIGD